MLLFECVSCFKLIRVCKGELQFHFIGIVRLDVPLEVNLYGLLLLIYKLHFQSVQLEDLPDEFTVFLFSFDYPNNFVMFFTLFILFFSQLSRIACHCQFLFWYL